MARASVGCEAAHHRPHLRLPGALSLEGFEAFFGQQDFPLVEDGFLLRRRLEGPDAAHGSPVMMKFMTLRINM